MATSDPTAPAPSLESRLVALEQKLAPLVASNSPKISTKVAGFLTAIATAITYAVSSGFLTPTQTAAATVIVGGISAYLTAEET